MNEVAFHFAVLYIMTIMAYLNSFNSPYPFYWAGENDGFASQWKCLYLLYLWFSDINKEKDWDNWKAIDL